MGTITQKELDTFNATVTKIDAALERMLAGAPLCHYHLNLHVIGAIDDDFMTPCHLDKVASWANKRLKGRVHRLPVVPEQSAPSTATAQ